MSDHSRPGCVCVCVQFVLLPNPAARHPPHHRHLSYRAFAHDAADVAVYRDVAGFEVAWRFTVKHGQRMVNQASTMGQKPSASDCPWNTMRKDHVSISLRKPWDKPTKTQVVLPGLFGYSTKNVSNKFGECLWRIPLRELRSHSPKLQGPRTLKPRMDGFEIQSPYQSSLTSLFGGCMKRVRAALLFLGNQPENGRKRCAEVGGSNHKGRVAIELIMSGSQIHQIPVRSQKEEKTPVSLLQFP